MEKTIKYFLLFLLFANNSSLADISDPEKINIIRQAAKSSSEGRIFYRWVSKQDRDTVLKNGLVSSEAYESFMKFKEDIKVAGPGLYMNHLLRRGVLDGETVLKIVTKRGYRFLDLSDRKAVTELAEQGVSLEDVYRLDSGVALEGLRGYSKYDLVFKGREGLRIATFTGKEVSLYELVQIFFVDLNLPQEIEDNFLSSIQKYIRERAGTYISIMEKNTSEEERNKEIFQQLVNDPASILSSLDLPVYVQIGYYLLMLGSIGKERNANILPKTNLRKMAKYILASDNYGNVLRILGENRLLPYLSPSDRSEVVQRVTEQINSKADGLEFLKDARGSLTRRNTSKIISAIIPFFTTLQDGAEFLADFDLYLKDKKKIADKMLEFAQSEEDIRSLVLPPADLEMIIEQFRHRQCKNSISPD